MNTHFKKSAWGTHPDYKINIHPLNQRILIMFHDEIIADSTNTLLLQEQNMAPAYYLPRADIRMNFLHAIEKTSFCGFKGVAKYWTLIVQNQRIDVAAWYYEEPFEEVKEIKNHIAFYPDAIEILIK